MIAHRDRRSSSIKVMVQGSDGSIRSIRSRQVLFVHVSCFQCLPLLVETSLSSLGLTATCARPQQGPVIIPDMAGAWKHVA